MTGVRIVTEPLGGSPLSRSLQQPGARGDWLVPRPGSAAAWQALARARAAEDAWPDRWTALMPALAPTGEAKTRLARVQREGGVVVTTGQQPGLFSGPIYTWSKAMSALALADEIQARTGVPTAAVYWAATDDADFAEAASTVVARAGGLEVLRADHAPPPGTPLALAPLGDLRAAKHLLMEASGSAPDARPLDALTDAYGDPHRSHGDAFVALLRALLAPLGVPVLDASHPAVIEQSAPTIRAALERAPAIEAALGNRAREMADAGFEPQVDDVRGLALAFVREGSTKRRLTVAEASRAAGRLTPNVLLRPIVERAILPTVAYVAGPAEVAYFAQVGAVAAAMEVPAPVVVPRWSCTLIEPRTQALLDRFGVAEDDLEPQGALEGRVARAAMSEATSTALTEMREAIAMLPDAIGEESEALRVGGAVVGAAKALQHRLDRLERRLVAALKRRERDQMLDLATLRAALRPRGARQERTLNIIPLLARNGCELLTEMHRAAGSHAARIVAGDPA